MKPARHPPYPPDRASSDFDLFDASLRFPAAISPSTGRLPTSPSDLDRRMRLLAGRWSATFAPLARHDEAAASSALASLGGALDSLVADASDFVAACSRALASLPGGGMLASATFDGKDAHSIAEFGANPPDARALLEVRCRR
jgi:hypothetical protein